MNCQIGSARIVAGTVNRLVKISKRCGLRKELLSFRILKHSLYDSSKSKNF